MNFDELLNSSCLDDILMLGKAPSYKEDILTMHYHSENSSLFLNEEIKYSED